DVFDGKFIQDVQELPGYTNPVFVAVDAQGHVWFTEPNSDAIGELDPQNTIWSQWNVLKGSAPFDLTFDASGNLWFTEFEANCIGFFNAHTHTFVENPIPTPDSKGAFHFFAPASAEPTGVTGGRLRKGLRQE